MVKWLMTNNEAQQGFRLWVQYGRDIRVPEWATSAFSILCKWGGADALSATYTSWEFPEEMRPAIMCFLTRRPFAEENNVEAEWLQENVTHE